MGQLSGRSIRTFVLRQGRLTEGQQRSIDQYWSQFGIDITAGDVKPEKGSARSKLTSPLPADSAITSVERDGALDVDRIDLNQHFSTTAPVWMEIGIGNGDALVHMAASNPFVNFLGVEVHLPGVGHALGEVANAELSNVRLIRYDVLDLIEHYLMPHSLDRVLIYFPDPWHKTRHHKRRMVNVNFLNLIAKLLKPQGLIHFASDWVPYAKQVELLVEEHPLFELVPDGEEAASVVRLRPETHFERRGLKLGHKVTDLVIRKS